ncbi:hypothetical protein Acor_83970 [Acrocarpospora corrugata]|uniref:SH3b domain-containing protein n=1 Tax=Acrocarpospora corrugata TaxID=35763 RepID=A0A5M3WIY6_9ACTN|nr:hypothetical protein [Acrocarpospora corrugata]GES06328.1 hypothetical protein Acor_83970 [Acrocarpospora corrugata]
MRTTGRLVLIAALAFCGAAAAPVAAHALPGQTVTTFADVAGRPSPCLNDTPMCQPRGIVKAGPHAAYCKVTGPMVVLGGSASNWWVLTDLNGSLVYIPAIYADNWQQISMRLPYC